MANVKIKAMFNLTREQHDYLKAGAKFHKISISQFLRDMIDTDMKKTTGELNAKNIK